METVRALIVDDEPLARRRLRSLLKGRRDVELAGECRNGDEAVDAISQLTPDLVFLDIQMPGLDGFGVVAAVGAENMPVVIFATAYDEYALEAFEAHALDYLLKPFDDERFAQALERALERIRQRRSRELCERLAALVASDPKRPEEPPPPRPFQRFAVERNGHTTFVAVSEVHWIEAQGAYVRLHTAEGSHLIRDSIKRLDTALGERFLRIHRSTMVDPERVAELQPLFHGEYQVMLKSGVRLKLSRTYRGQLERLKS